MPKIQKCANKFSSQGCWEMGILSTLPVGIPNCIPLRKELGNITSRKNLEDLLKLPRQKYNMAYVHHSIILNS